MYLCTQNYDLKRGGTFETAKAGTFHSVTAGTSIPLFTNYDKLRLTEGNVEGWAKHELKAIYMDIRTVADNEDDYQYLKYRYRLNRFQVIRKQVELVKAYKDLEMLLSQKKISKRDFRMQQWLIMDAFAHIEKQI